MPDPRGRYTRLIDDPRWDPVAAGVQDPPPRADSNPCLPLYGPGPAGVTCRTCARLQREPSVWRGTLSRCLVRPKDLTGTVTHRTYWPACARYQPVPPPRPLSATMRRLLTDLDAGGRVIRHYPDPIRCLAPDGTLWTVSRVTWDAATHNARGWIGQDDTLTDAGRQALAADRARGVGAG
jgi:hypothetical protein